MYKDNTGDEYFFRFGKESRITEIEKYLIRILLPNNKTVAFDNVEMNRVSEMKMKS
jgi:hypothetical protein